MSLVGIIFEITLSVSNYLVLLRSPLLTGDQSAV